MSDFENRKSIPAGNRPVVRTHVDGVPVHTFGHTGFYSESPTLVDDDTVQVSSACKPVKVHPKKSWEIKSNRLGVTTPRMPRSPQNDYQPLECINLIDGNDDTCWSSNRHSRPDDYPEWIRIDLAKEREICKITLKKRPIAFDRRSQRGSMIPYPGSNEVGRAMPGHLTIKASLDAYDWTVLHDGESGDSPDKEVFEFAFEPRRFKQIWIVGGQFAPCEDWVYSFSIASVGIYDTSGRNVALASYGNGITASSVYYGLGQEREAHLWYWGLHHDLGLKWSRIGYHDDPINWHWVEREKGVLAFDEEAEKAIDTLVDNGVNVIYALGFGNRLYQSDPTRHLPQLWEWYYENPEPPKTKEAIEAWGNFVRFSVEHFKDRIKYFEIWNEWNGAIYWGDTPDTQLYIRLAKMAIGIIRSSAPGAKIMLGSYAGFPHGIAKLTGDELLDKEKDDPFFIAISELAAYVDVIGYHPFYQPDTQGENFLRYGDNVKAFKNYCESKGFAGGEYMATEYTVLADYPPISNFNCWWGNVTYTEMQKAKIVSQLSVKHTALGVESFFCELWESTYPSDLSLLRRTFSSYPITPLTPQAAYYAVRNLSTALEELMPSDFGFEVLDAGQTGGILEAWAMERGGEHVLAVWFGGKTADDCGGWPLDFAFDREYSYAKAYNPLNGELFELDISRENNKTMIGGVIVRDYPLLLRLKFFQIPIDK